MTAHRVFIVRGSHPPVCGFEVSREGELLTLNTAEANWPFPRFNVFPRSALVWAGGLREPDAAWPWPTGSAVQQEPATC